VDKKNCQKKVPNFSWYRVLKTTLLLLYFSKLFWEIFILQYLFCQTVHQLSIEAIVCASARISKGQGYRGFLRKRAGSSFGQKRAICVVQGKT
jgi:hypothetical protein